MSTNEPPAGPNPPPSGEPVPPPPVGDPGTSAAPPPPPPPSGGMGGPPPPEQGGGYGAAPPGGPGAPPSAGSDWSIGNALGYGWAKFQANWQAFVLASLALLAGLAVLAILWVVLSGAFLGGAECETDPETFVTECDGGSGFIALLIMTAIFVGLFIVVSLIVGAMLIRAALDITEGKQVSTGTILKMPPLGPVVITALIIGGLTIVGTVLCYLPGLIVGYLTQFALYFVLDKKMSPMDAIKASVNLCRENLGNTILWYIVAAIVGGAGAILCGVGILVTYPIALIGTAYTYKKLTGQPVAP